MSLSIIFIGMREIIAAASGEAICARNMRIIKSVCCVISFVLLFTYTVNLFTSPPLTCMQYILAVLFSLVIGTYDGFYGSGTGTFLMIVFTAVIRLDVRQAEGNTKCVNWASNAAALATFIKSGSVSFILGAAFHKDHY